MRSSELPAEEGDFERFGLEEDGIEGVAVDRCEAHRDVEGVCSWHAVGHGVEIHGGIAARACRCDDGLGELAADLMALMRGADPEAFHFAGALVGADVGQGFEGDAAGRFPIVEGEEEDAVGFGVGCGQAG